MRYLRRRMDRGVCPHCPTPLDINQRTGKPFWLCVHHRAKHSKRTGRTYQDRNQQGVCMTCPTKVGINQATGKPFARCQECAWVINLKRRVVKVAA